MIASASLLLAHGTILLFASEFPYRLFDLGTSAGGSVGAQLFGAALIGLGLMNWTARGIALGGIYGRALVYGNFAWFFIGFLVSFRAHLNGFGNGYFWTEVVLFLGLALAFGLLLFKGRPAETNLRRPER